MSPSRSTRSRKIVKLKRKPPPRPERMEAPRPEGGRQGQDRIAVQPDAQRPRRPINSKLIAIWGAGCAVAAGFFAMLIAAATWVYDASAPVTASAMPRSHTEMPASPRRGAPTGDTMGGSGRAGRMALLDGAPGADGGGAGPASAGGTGSGAGGGRSTTCKVQVTNSDELEKTLTSCIAQHNAP